jgi:hypothetical protein
MLKCRHLRKDGICSKLTPDPNSEPIRFWKPVKCPYNGDAQKCHDFVMDFVFQVLAIKAEDTPMVG